MIVSDLLGSPVRDSGDGRVGWVIDVRFEVDANDLLLVGILVNRRNRSSFLGYERREASAPWLLNRLFGWLHRGTVLIPWDDIADVGEDGVRVRQGFRQLDASLPAS